MLGIIVCTILLFIFLWFSRKEKCNIPGPKGLPILGNILQIDMTKPHLKFADWAKEYGGLYKVNLAGNTAYIINGPAELQEVFVTKGKDFSGRPRPFRVWEMDGDDNFSSSILNPKMHGIKKEILQYMRKERNEEVVQDVIRSMIKHFEDTGGDPCDVRQIVQETAANVMFLLAIGRTASDKELDEMNRFLKLMTEIWASGGPATLLDSFPWLRFFGFKAWKQIQEYKQLRGSMYQVWRQEIMEKLHEDHNEKSFLIKLLQIQTGDNPLDYTDINTEHTVWNVFGGGISTTTSSFTSLINILVHESRVQDELFKESQTVLDGRPASFSDKIHMPYHMATIYETLRYVSSLPFGLPHATVSETSVGGHKIATGSAVWTNSWALHHDEQFWDDPYTFRPERFLDPSGSLVPADHPTRKHLLAFGAGPRVCPAEVFALSRLFLLLANVVQHFELLPGTILAQQPSSDCRSSDLGLVLFPKPFQGRFKSR